MSALCSVQPTQGWGNRYREIVRAFACSATASLHFCVPLYHAQNLTQRPGSSAILPTRKRRKGVDKEGG